MCPIFDFEDGDFVFPITDKIAVDSDGDIMMRVSDNLAVDMNSGDIHFVSGWSNDDNE